VIPLTKTAGREALIVGFVDRRPDVADVARLTPCSQAARPRCAAHDSRARKLLGFTQGLTGRLVPLWYDSDSA